MHTVEISGEEAFEAENILEIVPVGASQYYVRIETWSHNAHRCKFYGITELVQGGLNYQGPLEEFLTSRVNPTPPPRLKFEPEVDRCLLSVTRSFAGDAEVLVLSDRGNRCQQKHCGANGYLNEVSWNVNSRGVIRYMDRLKASTEYLEALKEAGLKSAQ